MTETGNDYEDGARWMRRTIADVFRVSHPHFADMIDGLPTRGERVGFDCAKCGHRHAGIAWAHICVGCPCIERHP